MRLSFFGAAREVTGSNTLVQIFDKKILIECGLFQGFKMAEERNFQDFPYNPAEIDFVIVCHAHLDHTGRLPKLVKDGFSGKVFCTSPTKELARLVLEDSEKLMREEAEKDDSQALYTIEHIQKLMGQVITLDYDKKFKVSDGINITFKNAGHILGSATLLIESADGKLVYTSDLGNTPSLLLNPPDTWTDADYLICESTYGGRVHEDILARKEKLADIIFSVIAAGSVLMIPTFAIERTQELLHDIDDFCTIKKCDKPKFFLDSPLAEKVTNVYKKYSEYFSEKLKREHPDNDFFGETRFEATSSVEASKAIDKAPNPKVIIAGSGMMNGGRILFHLAKYLPDEKNTLLIVGYQARGTLGRRLLEGADEVKIFRQKIPVRAKIKAIGSYSAHADMPQIISWVSKIKGLKRVFLVHGETDQSLVLAKKMGELGLSCEIPQQGESYLLDKEDRGKEAEIWQKSYQGY